MTDATPIDDEVIERLISEAEHQEKRHYRNPGGEQFYHCVANALRYQQKEIVRLETMLDHYKTQLLSAT